MNELKLLDAVKEIAYNAGEFMREGMIHTVKSKSDASNIVTDMDVKTQDFVIRELMPLIPDAKFFAEEKENQELDASYTWIIDPIDGTTNYAYDYRHSCVSIALAKDRKPILGVCADPYLHEVFFALKGHGAYCNDRIIHVSDYDLTHSLIMCGTSPYHKQYADVTFTKMKELFLTGRDIRRSGSAVLDLCYLACGRVDAFYEAHISFWDYAAASFILMESGGIFHPFDGQWGDLEPIGIAAGNPQNINELLDIVLR